MNDHNNKDIALQGFVNNIKTIINTAYANAVLSVTFAEYKCTWLLANMLQETCSLRLLLTRKNKSIINWILRMMVE